MIKEELNKLYEKDIYSLVLFIIYQLHNVPEYATLSELIYVVDKVNLLNLCEYFGGATITIPTKEEMADVIDTLLLYSYVTFEHKDFSESLDLITTKQKRQKRIKQIYSVVEGVVEKYDFGKRE